MPDIQIIHHNKLLLRENELDDVWSLTRLLKNIWKQIHGHMIKLITEEFVYLSLCFSKTNINWWFSHWFLATLNVNRNVNIVTNNRFETEFNLCCIEWHKHSWWLLSCFMSSVYHVKVKTRSNMSFTDL